MKIADIRFAYPNIEYKVDVSHFTARASTAIEWVILEAIKRCGELTEYSNWSAADIFETIFMVADPDLLVLPCMISLLDLGAIAADDLSDDSELSEIPMKSLRLTQVGAEMQRRGLLPGVPDINDINVGYDPLSGKLIPVSDNGLEKPDGIPLIDADELQNIGFPQAAVMDMLMAEVRSEKKGSKRFPWLMPNTKIEQLEVVETNILWKSVIKPLVVGEGLVCSIEGNNNPDVVAQALKSIAGDKRTENLSYLNISNPDNDVKEIIEFDDIGRKLDTLARSGNTVIINNNYFTSDISQNKTEKNGVVHIVIVDESPEFKISVKDRLFIIFYDGKLLSQDAVFVSDKLVVHVGKLKLRSSGIEQDLAIGYIPLSCPENIAELAKQAVTSRLNADYRMPLVLYALGFKNECLEVLTDSVKHTEKIADKAEVIEKINMVGKDMFRMTCFSPELAKKLLVDTMDIAERCISVDAAIDVLGEYENFSMHKQDDLYTTVLKTVLENMPAVDSPSELYRLWKHIKSVKRAYMTYVIQNNLYQRFYDETVMGNLFKSFNNDDFLALVVEEYTPVESSLYNIRQAFNITMEILSEIGTDSDEETVRAAVIQQKDNIKQLQGAVRDWRNGLDKIEDTATSLPALDNDDRRFNDSIKLMNNVIDAVSLFCDTSSVKYSNVVVADTCALMHEPNLISWCDDDRTLLIIPQTVLTELDKLKDDEDEDKSYQARMAIRSIESYQAFEWLNIKEVSDVSLLNVDLDPESGDSKILSVAIRYIVKSPTIITDDINFRNIAEAQGIAAISTESYHKQKKYETQTAASSKGDKKNNGKKNKKR